MRKRTIRHDMIIILYVMRESRSRVGTQRQKNRFNSYHENWIRNLKGIFSPPHATRRDNHRFDITYVMRGPVLDAKKKNFSYF